MIFRGGIFFVLIRQSICYVQQSGCSISTFNKFTKCPVRTYCGITDTGAYECLPCPAGKLCPGDGYTYPVQQLNNPVLTDKYIINGSYIVSSNSSNRILFRKKLKRIVQIAKVGLKVAIIAKTGGVGALKMAAAHKIKEIAVKKGIQCLKNGFDNFCNGKKKGAKLGSYKKIKSKLKQKVGSHGRAVVKRGKNKPANIKINKKQIATKKTKPSSISKSRTNRTRTRPKSSISKNRPTKAKTKAKTKKRPSKNAKKIKVKSKQKKSPNLSNPCANIFDSLAHKVNNVTRHIADNTVNNGRDWLKKNVGGNTGDCKPVPIVKQPTNLRGSKSKGKEKRNKPRPTTGSESSSGTNADTDDSPNNSNADDGSLVVSTARPVARPRSSIRKQPVKRQPVIKTDDSTVTSNPTSRQRPVIKTDDSTVTENPTFRPIRQSITRSRTKSRPVKITRMPITRPTRVPISTPTIRPTIQATILLSAPPTAKLSRIPTQRPSEKPSVRPSEKPSVRPSVKPSAVPSAIPSLKPSARPSPKPSATPTFFPTTIAGPPTMIPGNSLSWAIFSNAPTIRSNIPPTLLPTVSMFTMDTSTPSTRATLAPSSLRTTTTVSLTTRTPTITPNPSFNPTLLPSQSPTVLPSLIPTMLITNAPSLAPSLAPTLTTTGGGLSSSSISGASTSQTGTSTVAIGVGIGCIFLVIIMMCAFIFFRNKKEKKTPYQVWSSYYSDKTRNQPTNLVQNLEQNLEQNANQDIHHFYNRTPRPSIDQPTVFTPHLSAKTTYRNSQLGGQLGSQRNSHRESIYRGSASQPMVGRNGKNSFAL